MKRVLPVWNALGSIRLTVALCILLVADLGWGYLCLHGNAAVFAPLNDVGLASWAATYGRHNWIHTAWFFLLLGLLALFCVNTFVCTTDRVWGLIRARRRLTAGRFFFKLAPHLMHYGVILLLAGYLVSYAFAHVVAGRTLIPGAAMTLPGTDAAVAFSSISPVYYEGGRLDAFRDRAIAVRAELSLSDGNRTETATLGLNRPVYFKGYGIFLKYFTPSRKGSVLLGRPRIDITVRRDPGVRVYLAGMALFTAGLLIYLAEQVFPKRKKEPYEST